MRKFTQAGAVLICALILTGCETMNNPSQSSARNNGSNYDNNYENSRYSSNKFDNQSAIYSGYGVVQSIELVRQDSQGIGESGIGLGAIAGAVVGGVAGHQVGSGSGNTAATILGTVGGAYVGNQLENRQQQPVDDSYKITVRMENRTNQILMLQNNNSGFRVGDRVRINNGVLERY